MTLKANNQIRIECDHFVLYADDPLALPALQAYVMAAEQRGYLALAAVVAKRVQQLMEEQAR